MRKTPGREALSSTGSRATLTPATRWQQRRTKKIRIASSVSQPEFSTTSLLLHRCDLMAVRRTPSYPLNLQTTAFLSRPLLKPHAFVDFHRPVIHSARSKRRKFSQTEAGDDSVASGGCGLTKHNGVFRSLQRLRGPAFSRTPVSLT